MMRRERILSAIRREATECVPVGFKASWDILHRLQDYYGVDNIFSLLNVLPVDTYGVMNNCDTGVYPLYRGGPEYTLYPDTRPDGTWDTIYGYQRRRVPCRGGTNEEVIANPLGDATTIDELESYDWPRADWFDYSTIRDQCEKAGDPAIVFLGGSLWQSAHLLGFQRVLMDLVTAPDLVDCCFTHLTEFFVASTERVLRAADGRIDIVCVQDDLGTQDSLLISKEMYRRFFKPHHEKLFAVAHRHNARTMLHSCGSVFAYIPDFLDIGVEVLDPIQTTASNMDPRRLKREYGKDLCFHGGLDTQGTLRCGTPDDVKREMDYLVNTLGNGGGYILAPSHYIQSDTPMENILALFDRIREYRGES